jgi:hypothetical protein
MQSGGFDRKAALRASEYPIAAKPPINQTKTSRELRRFARWPESAIVLA